MRKNRERRERRKGRKTKTKHIERKIKRMEER
jgi:hypothetical protein